MNVALESLRRLQQGNQRFVAGQLENTTISSEQRAQLAEGQSPFAVILGCSDSRVPVELVFDQGPGDLFVVRVAGNVAAPSQIGSVEFAVSKFGCQLVVVLGHSRCGAIEATLGEIRAPSADLSESLRSVVNCITPAVNSVLENAGEMDHESLVHEAIRANVQLSVDTLYESKVIASYMQAGDLKIVGANYDLATGEVEFFDGADK